jgi:hypothetical protein
MQSRPYLVNCLEPSVPLFRLADGRYQLTKDGPIAPFMDGPGYFLVERHLADFLEELDISGLRNVRAVIWHRRIDKEYATHSNLIVDRFFTSSTIDELDLTGNQVYSMDDRYLFVSPELKDRLQCSAFGYLRFSDGLSDFAGFL